MATRTSNDKYIVGNNDLYSVHAKWLYKKGVSEFAVLSL
jgi:hypothetical protein